jgi:hypothetical protein
VFVQICHRRRCPNAQELFGRRLAFKYAQALGLNRAGTFLAKCSLTWREQHRCLKTKCREKYFEHRTVEVKTKPICLCTQQSLCWIQQLAISWKCLIPMLVARLKFLWREWIHGYTTVQCLQPIVWLRFCVPSIQEQLEMLHKEEQYGVDTVLKYRRLRWAGYVDRMDIR